MPTANPLVTAAQIARLAGVTRATVSNWRRRHPDFPAPAGGGDARPVYDLQEVRAWLSDRGQLPPGSPTDELGEALRAQPSVAPPWPLLLAAARLDAAELKAIADLPDRRLVSRTQELATTGAPEVPGASRYQPKDGNLVRLLLRCLHREGAARTAEVLAESDDTLTAGGYPTPEPLAELMAELLADPAGTYPVSVLDPACGRGRLLSAAAARGAQTVSGQDIAGNLAAQAAVRLSLQGISAGAVNIRVGDSVREDAFEGLEAEAVLCNPPYGVRDWGHDELAYDSRWSYGLPARGEPELAWVQHCLAHLVEGGTAVLLMPPAAGERPAGRRVRAELVRQGALRAVVGLPAGIAQPWHVGLHLWLLHRPRPQAPIPATVLFVDASVEPDVREPDRLTELRRTVWKLWLSYAPGEDDFEPLPGTARAVPVTDLLDDLVDLAPARHVHAAPTGHRPEQHADTSEALRARLRRATAGLAALSGGTPWAPAGAEPRDWRTATVGDLLRGGAVTLLRPAGRRDTDEPASDEVQVVAGDIILSEQLRRHAPAATVADERTAGQHLSRSWCLLRPDPQRFDPWFLAGFLSADDNLHAASTGTSTVRVDPRRLRVPLLSLAEQRRYGKAFRRLHALRTAADLAARLAGETTRTLSAGLTAGALLPPETAADPDDSSTSSRGTG
jgi:hypothetical protein